MILHPNQSKKLKINCYNQKIVKQESASTEKHLASSLKKTSKKIWEMSEGDIKKGNFIFIYLLYL